MIFGMHDKAKADDAAKVDDAVKVAELPLSGCGSLTDEQYDRIYDEFIEEPCDSALEKFFLYGFMCGLAFVSTPEDAEMHGKSALEFAKNAFYGTLHVEVTETLGLVAETAAKSYLKERGIDGSDMGGEE